MLGPGVGQSLTSLVRRYGPARAKALYAATLRAVEDVRRLVAREHIKCELRMTGHLVAALNPASRMRLTLIRPRPATGRLGQDSLMSCSISASS